jgi:hypothetical protein
LLVVGLLRLGGNVHGAQLPQRSLELGTAEASKTTTYTLGFTTEQQETLGSIRLQICANDPIIGDACDPPDGFDMSSAQLVSQVGTPNDYTITSRSANELLLSHPPAQADIGAFEFTLSGITNPSAAGTYYGRLLTYPTQDGSGQDTDHGGLAMSITSNLQISATVPPYLYFCSGLTISGTDCTTAQGNYINLGELSTKAASAAQSQMVAGTNADTGYTITMGGTTMTSGNNVIPGLVTPNVSRPGTSQFGLNLVGNQDPLIGQNPAGGGSGQPTSAYDQSGRYQFVDNDVIAQVSQPDLPRKYTVSYIVNIAANQAPGIYVSTLTYVAAAKF